MSATRRCATKQLILRAKELSLCAIFAIATGLLVRIPGKEFRQEEGILLYNSIQKLKSLRLRLQAVKSLLKARALHSAEMESISNRAVLFAIKLPHFQER